MLNTFGSQIVSSQLAGGFTVVHTDDGDEFALGQLQPPQRPAKPFATDKGKFVFANETTEVHSEQVDFLVRTKLSTAIRRSFCACSIAGRRSMSSSCIRGTGDLWRSGLQIGQALAPPSGAPITQFSLQANADVRQKIKLPPVSITSCSTTARRSAPRIRHGVRSEWWAATAPWFRTSPSWATPTTN